MTILVPNDEYQARVELIAWLAYPLNDRFRLRAQEALRDLARHVNRQGTNLRHDRLEPALQRIDLNLNRSLLAGEFFRRQIWEMRIAADGLPSSTSFGKVSTKAVARRMANGGLGSDERESRRLLTKAAPILHLAVGAGDGLAERPSILTRLARGAAGEMGVKVPGLLLNDSRHWTAKAVRLAQQIRSDALRLGHPRARQLMQVSVFPLPLQ